MLVMDFGNLSQYTSKLKEVLDHLFVSMAADLKEADASLKRHHTALKTQDKSLEQVYDLIATLERWVNHCKEQSHVDGLRIDGLENENFVLRESHDDLTTTVRAMEARINWLVPWRYRCVDRLDRVLQADSEASDTDDDESDALTYTTDQSYRTPPQEESSVLRLIEVEEVSTCACPPSVPIASDPIVILDSKEEEDKENDIWILEPSSPIPAPRTVEDAVRFQCAICLGYQKPKRPSPYPYITFPRLAYPGLSLQAEIRRNARKACGVSKIASQDNRQESGYDCGHSGGDDGEESDSESIRYSDGLGAADFDQARGSGGGSPCYQPEESPVGDRAGVGYRDARRESL